MVCFLVTSGLRFAFLPYVIETVRIFKKYFLKFLTNLTKLCECRRYD